MADVLPAAAGDVGLTAADSPATSLSFLEPQAARATARARSDPRVMIIIVLFF
jgi:hypothetical protein